MAYNPRVAAHLVSLALRVHRMDAMRAFYADAFGAVFESVDAGGLECWFGRTPEGLLFKLVPLRDEVDHEGYPLHQPGFRVDDIERVLAAARAHGGALEGEVAQAADGSRHACVRDPDGNTLELRCVGGA